MPRHSSLVETASPLTDEGCFSAPPRRRPPLVLSPLTPPKLMIDATTLTSKKSESRPMQRVPPPPPLLSTRKASPFSPLASRSWENSSTISQLSVAQSPSSSRRKPCFGAGAFPSMESPPTDAARNANVEPCISRKDEEAAMRALRSKTPPSMPVLGLVGRRRGVLDGASASPLVGFIGHAPWPKYVANPRAPNSADDDRCAEGFTPRLSLRLNTTVPHQRQPFRAPGTSSRQCRAPGTPGSYGPMWGRD
jgi:hypothetical protein